MGILTICALAFIVLGGVFLIIGILQMRKAKSAESWPTASGTILAADLEKRSSHNSKTHRTTITYIPKVQYQYQIAGSTFNGNKISFGTASYDYDTASAKLSAYPIGGNVTVHFDPAEPTNAVLELKAAGSSALLTLGGILIGTGIVVLIVT